IGFGVFFAVSALAIETIGMTMRVLISGRAPITNMYETVMFSGFGALLIALIVMIFKRDKIFLLAGFGYNVLCLFMMKFANNMLDPSISPLVPVLRDNFWLSTHVTTIILSYAALALSWILANMILFKNKFGTLSKKDYRYYEQLIGTAVKVGVVLLAAGIILGGIWADYSWGRFWGWDPKETWSLIVLLFYMAVLHARQTTWVNTHRFVVLVAGGFMTVMMAWFGVNYILATGLHSYGFSEGGAIFLGTFFLVQTVVLIICGISLKGRKDALAKS
ncbi:MAG: cytochrome c biogenesis protein CcsA, partial [Bacteriovoracaceae bacterium]